MEKQLPKNWVETEIGIIGEVITGNTPSKKHPEFYDGEIPWIKPGDIRTGIELFDSVEKLTIEGIKNARLIPKGAVMVTCIGNLGNVAIAGVKMATNQQINSVVFDSNINDKFGYYACNLLKPWLIENSTSTTISMVNKSIFKKAPFPLPPLAEQQRIVAKLDELFGHLETLKIRLNNIPELLENFRQAVLNKEYLVDVKQEVLANVCIKIQDGAHHSPKNQFPIREKGMFPYVTSKNIRNNYMKLDTLVFVNEDFHNTIYPRCSPEKGDVLLTKDGANTGNVTLNEFDEPISLLSSVCLIKTDKEKLNSSFLKYYIQSPIGIKEIIGEMTGTAIKRIVLRKIKASTIPLPSLKEQTEIVKRVEHLFLKADVIEAQYKKLKAKIDSLPQAILAKAFKGELVEQLPTDGDAKELLEEIKRLKEAMALKSKTVRKKKK